MKDVALYCDWVTHFSFQSAQRFLSHKKHVGFAVRTFTRDVLGWIPHWTIGSPNCPSLWFSSISARYCWHTSACLMQAQSAPPLSASLRSILILRRAYRTSRYAVKLCRSLYSLHTYSGPRNSSLWEFPTNTLHVRSSPVILVTNRASLVSQIWSQHQHK